MSFLVDGRRWEELTGPERALVRLHYLIRGVLYDVTDGGGLVFACARCGAAPGARCRTRGGRTCGHHTSRWRQYDALADKLLEDLPERLESYGVELDLKADPDRADT